jgi:hypothetical protein
MSFHEALKPEVITFHSKAVHPFLTAPHWQCPHQWSLNRHGRLLKKFRVERGGGTGRGPTFIMIIIILGSLPGSVHSNFW